MNSEYLRKEARWQGLAAVGLLVVILIEGWAALGGAFSAGWLVVLALAVIWQLSFVFVLLRARQCSLAEADRQDWQRNNLGEEAGQ